MLRRNAAGSPVRAICFSLLRHGNDVVMGLFLNKCGSALKTIPGIENAVKWSVVSSRPR